jgi:hypothetical protein
MIRQEGDVLEAGLADLVEDCFYVAVFGAGVGFDVDGFLGTATCGVTKGVGEVGWREAVVAKVN